MTIKAVVVDIDDTLCLTECVCFEMENEVMLRMGRQPFYRGVHLETWGVSLKDAIVIRSPGIDYEEFKSCFQPVLQEYIKVGKLDIVTPDNYKTLEYFIDNGKKVILLTSREESELAHFLSPSHKLSSIVHEIYHKDNIKYHKPDPRAFDELLLNNSLIPSECVYVGDSPGDAESAIGAGLYFIATLESGIRNESDFDKYNVSAFVDKFPDIINVIDKL